MPRDRYIQILSDLHFVDNKQKLTARQYKVEKVLELIKGKIMTHFYPYKNIVVDESMVLFRRLGRLGFKQYIKTKKNGFELKLYVLCDCETGIVLDFIVYIGNDTKQFIEKLKGLGSSGSVVVSLMKPYLDKRHNLFRDNYYSVQYCVIIFMKETTN